MVLYVWKKNAVTKILYGEAKIVESYDETLQCFRIHVQVRNPLIGSLFSYKEHLWKGNRRYEKYNIWACLLCCFSNI